MILVGDVREQLRTLPADSVHCVVTSPPYWGLRDYGTGEWEGGDSECDHLPPNLRGHDERRKSTLVGTVATIAEQERGARAYRDICGKCGAKRVDHQIGLEPTMAEFVDKMVAVFREVKRVLRDDGTCWVNLGDSYNAYNGGAGPGSTLSKTQTEARPRLESGYGLRSKGLKPKDLCGIPWRVAFALQADGWYLRSDIIWAKPNPMPESVTDRPTKAHEYLFLLTKSARYYYDAEAIREEHTQAHSWGNERRHLIGEDRLGAPTLQTSMRLGNHPAGRNKRTVWTIATQPYPEAHFATYPEALVKPCILAGCPKGGTVLDPFLGSGTTAVVAAKEGRRWIGIELNPEYAALAEKRIPARQEQLI